jgi:hypothetical protein
MDREMADRFLNEIYRSLEVAYFSKRVGRHWKCRLEGAAQLLDRLVYLAGKEQAAMLAGWVQQAQDRFPDAAIDEEKEK